MKLVHLLMRAPLSRRNSVLCLMIVLFFSYSSISQGVSDEQESYLQALTLYQKGLYSSSRVDFESFMAQYPNSSFMALVGYYRASSAVRLGAIDGQGLMIDFVEKNDQHPLAFNAVTDLVNYYFTSGDYDKIVEFVSEYDLAKFSEKEPALNFKIGYAYFDQKDFENALNYLKKLNETSPSLKSDAAYFIGIIEKEQGNRELAGEAFKEALPSEEFGQGATKQYAMLLFEDKDYQGVIELLEGEDVAHTDAEVLKILGEANFEVGKYRMAFFNFTEYNKSTKGRRDHDLYYKLGYSAYQLKDDGQAELNFKQAALSKDTIGAYASYYLGLLYLKIENYPFATSAFNNVIKFNNELKKEALFLTAKTEFDQAHYTQSIPLFSEYSSLYPNGEHATLVSEMLSEAYLHTDNYEVALGYMEGLGRLTTKQEGYYQHVAFSKGMELFNKRRFYESVGFFKKAMIYREDRIIHADANYWTAEAYTIGKKYDLAIPFYMNAAVGENLVNRKRALYGLGYAFYNLKRYDEALIQFKQFIDGKLGEIQPRYYSDAVLRIGDCSFVDKEYDDAIQSYQQAINDGVKNVVYAKYQIGLSWRYMDKIDEAEKQFEKLLSQHENSEKADDALFQIGQLNYENGEFPKAISTFEELVKKFPDSRYIPYAILNAAVSYNNQKIYTEAIQRFQLIIEKYSRHSTANSALLGLQELSAIGEFDEFDLYLQKYKKANPESTALENIEYETAKNQYYNQQYDKAIAAFEKFMNSYPESDFETEAQFFVGDSWFKQNKWEEALNEFQEIEEVHEFPKFLRVQYRIAAIEQKLEHFEVSNKYFHNLLKGANNIKETNNANKGLMENYYSLATYDSAIYYGERLLNSSRISTDVELLSNLIIGKSLYYSEKIEEAKDWLILLINDSPDAYGAEAKYYIALIFHEAEDYKHSLQTLFELTDTYRAYELWVGKSFLLMADNYVATNEDFQATATLTSLVENSPIDGIVQQAKEKLRNIEERSASLEEDSIVSKRSQND